MDWLNYHHLRYFWVTAREGSLRKAAEELGISQPSISAQIHQLEENLGAPLFRKSGRGQVLTDTGKMVFDYAEEIFALGRDLLNSVRLQEARVAPFHVGLTDTVPKPAASEILKPVFSLPNHAKVVVHEGDLEDLLPRLASHKLDIILADEPAPSSAKIKAHNHSLGSCDVTFCASAKLASKLKKGFPQSLHGAPALLPAEHSTVRRQVERWFEGIGVRPNVVAEFDDPAFMQVFALETVGFFPLHSVAVDAAVKRYGFHVIASVPTIRSEFFAITGERKLRHPATMAVTENAQLRLFVK
ncbi:MAG: LysR family transcriptional regulator [Verrucomicrobium sp.]|nr:LysR family transcriptional regulator [Verrucomicrobium sp.]